MKGSQQQSLGSARPPRLYKSVYNLHPGPSTLVSWYHLIRRMAPNTLLQFTFQAPDGYCWVLLPNNILPQVTCATDLWLPAHCAMCSCICTCCVHNSGALNCCDTSHCQHEPRICIFQMSCLGSVYSCLVQSRTLSQWSLSQWFLEHLASKRLTPTAKTVSSLLQGSAGY